MNTILNTSALSTVQFNSLLGRLIKLDLEVRTLRYQYIPKAELYIKAAIVDVDDAEDPDVVVMAEQALTCYRRQLSYFQSRLASLQKKLDKLNDQLYPPMSDEDDDEATPFD